MKTELKKIKNEVLNCKKCLLYKSRKYPVIGQGNHSAKIMFIGEAPGYNEDQTGRPFCGIAGKILDELLEEAGLERKDVYITNILKCRPPENRDPRNDEIKACSPYLLRQVEIIKPKIICTLGNYATRFIFEKFNIDQEFSGISKIHGKIFTSESILGCFKIIPLYHPAVATYNQNMKGVLKNDFRVLKKQ
jgi:uracil-DNA glycosylase